MVKEKEESVHECIIHGDHKHFTGVLELGRVDVAGNMGF